MNIIKYILVSCFLLSCNPAKRVQRTSFTPRDRAIENKIKYTQPHQHYSDRVPKRGQLRLKHHMEINRLKHK